MFLNDTWHSACKSLVLLAQKLTHGVDPIVVYPSLQPVLNVTCSHLDHAIPAIVVQHIWEWFLHSTVKLWWGLPSSRWSQTSYLKLVVIITTTHTAWSNRVSARKSVGVAEFLRSITYRSSRHCQDGRGRSCRSNVADSLSTPNTKQIRCWIFLCFVNSLTKCFMHPSCHATRVELQRSYYLI